MSSYARPFLFFILAASVALVMTPAPLAHAQSANSSVEGLVQDSTGAVIPDAEVVLTNLGTSVPRTTRTNEVGRYVIPSVPAGSYAMRVSKQGFETYVLSQFTVVVAQRATEDVVLKLGAVTQSVTVQAAGLTPLLEPSSNELGTLIAPTSVQRLPLNGRNFLQLGLLSGATQDSGTALSDFVSAQGGHPARSINIGGNQQDLSMYLINGIATSGSRIGDAELNLSIAAIDQFKVRHGFFLPGLGPDPGIVNVITKTGSNSFHGEVFEFIRNNNLDARNFFDTKAPPPFHRNQFGVAGGGPILKDRLFFFANYEGLRQIRTDQGRAFAPSARMFGGDFSELLPRTPIFDPLSFDPATGTRKAFANNIILPDRINPVAKKLLKFYRPGSSFAERPFNFFTTVPTSFDSGQGTLRIDANPTPRNALFGQYSEEASPVINAGPFPLSGSAFPLNTELAMFQWTATVSPRLVNELRAGWSRGFIFFDGEEQAGIASEVGIPGTADPNGLSGIGITGFAGFGHSGGLLGNIDNLYQLHDALNYLRGNHQTQFGADLRYARSIQQSANANARGTISFDSVFTAQLAPNAKGQLAPVPGTGNAFADFLLGMPINGQVVSMPRTHFRWTQFEPYFQDSWKIRPNLTANLGLSWFLGTPPNPVGPDKKFPHALDFRTGQVLFAALRQIDPKVYETDHNNFTPRVGLAWEPSFVKNTVVRAGFGVYFASQRVLDQQFAIIAPGVTITQSLSNNQFDPLPSFIFGQNVFPPIAQVPITPEFAKNITGTLFDFDTRARTPYVEQWTFGIQHTFGQSNLLELDYVGSEAHKVNSRINGNDCSVPGSLRCDPAVVPFKQFPFVLFALNDGNSNYHAFVTKFQRQFSGGFSLLANYTWSKVLTNSMEAGSAGTLSQIAACRRCDKGLAAFNVPHRLVISSVYELPFGRRKHYLNNLNPFLDRVVGGWNLDLVSTFSRGNPFEVNAPNRSGAVFTDFRADRLCNGRGTLSNLDLRANGGFWFDPNCFRAPSPGLFGTSGFNILTGPGINNWDIGIEKNTTIRESLRVQFRSEFFNAFNHAQFLNPVSNVADPRFGQVVGARASREIQFGLKVLW